MESSTDKGGVGFFFAAKRRIEMSGGDRAFLIVSLEIFIYVQFVPSPSGGLNWGARLRQICIVPRL